jgi:Rad3-related DNA helicase
MAADLAARVYKSKKVRMTLAAGQGKTMVYILTAMLLNRKFPLEYNKILVVTISFPLQNQLEGIIINHPIDV